MRATASLTAALLLAVTLVGASSCASSPTPQPTLLLPDARDLRPEAKPRLDPAALGSEHALNEHDDQVEAWGERGWATVGRLCRWFVTNGAELPFDCPPAPPDS